MSPRGLRLRSRERRHFCFEMTRWRWQTRPEVSCRPASSGWAQNGEGELAWLEAREVVAGLGGVLDQKAKETPYGYEADGVARAHDGDVPVVSHGHPVKGKGQNVLFP